MNIQTEFFVWLFEEYLFEYIKAGKDKFDIIFSSTEIIAYLPNKTFKWPHEIDKIIPEIQYYHVLTLLTSESFISKAEESLSYWKYECSIGYKDVLGLRCHLSAMKKK